MKGFRKLLAGFVALLFVTGAYVLCVFHPTGFVGFDAYATTVGSILGLVVVGNVGEHFAKSKKPEVP